MSPSPKEKTPAGLEYTCPMHPEVRKPEPGNCHICGMTLELVVSAGVQEEIVE